MLHAHARGSNRRRLAVAVAGVAGVLMVMLALIASGGAPTAEAAIKVKSATQTSGLTCDQARTSILRAYGYVLNVSGRCISYGANLKIINAPTRLYMVGKVEDGTWPRRVWNDYVTFRTKG